MAEPDALILETGRYIRRAETAPDLHSVAYRGGTEGDVFYRDRWSHDRIVYSTHGVNCTGSCRWKVYVEDGIITWETQATDYPSVGPDRPEYEPRGCPPGRVVLLVCVFAHPRAVSVPASPPPFRCVCTRPRTLELNHC